MKTKLLLTTCIGLVFLSCDKEPIELPKNPISVININEKDLVHNFGTEATEKIIFVSSDYGWQYRRKDNKSTSWLFIKDYVTDNKLGISVAQNRKMCYTFFIASH